MFKRRLVRWGLGAALVFLAGAFWTWLFVGDRPQADLLVDFFPPRTPPPPPTFTERLRAWLGW